VEDRRNIILAVLLTGLILFGWPYVANMFFPTPPPAEKSVAAPAKTDGTPSESGEIATAAAPDKTVSLASALSTNPRVLVETPKLKGSINLEGARIDDLVLTDAPARNLSKKSPPMSACLRLRAPQNRIFRPLSDGPVKAQRLCPPTRPSGRQAVPSSTP
jgi:YidC/Oxa1 family membrane protein insertase